MPEDCKNYMKECRKMYKWTESKDGGINNVFVVMSDDGTTATSKKGFEQAEKNLKRKQKSQ